MKLQLGVIISLSQLLKRLVKIFIPGAVLMDLPHNLIIAQLAPYEIKRENLKLVYLLKGRKRVDKRYLQQL